MSGKICAETVRLRMMKNEKRVVRSVHEGMILRHGVRHRRSVSNGGESK